LIGEILKKISNPADLKELSLAQLEQIAKEIRSFLLETVAHTGGHLAPNLGVVELTLALHTVFNTPEDQLIWDVGHQSYVHKLLTGRLDKFETLRQYQGLSGFPKPEESIYDSFATGHSTTSISAGLGMAKARDLMGKDYKVISIIGDGSMTGGMAFEALNHLGHLQTDMIVVLNDNEMSISKNVGALSRYLNRLRMNPRLRRLKYDVQDLIQKIPRVGRATVRYLEKMEDLLTYMLIPGMFFEELGISYLGPINGHDISELMMAMRNAIIRKGPVMIHVLTTKGKGYELAEQNPSKFHGTGPFQLDNGQKIGNSSLSYTDIFGATLVELAQLDQRIVAITAAMTDGTGLVEFSKKFPERFFDVGIAEEHAVTMAAGLAKQGIRPVVAIYSTFFQRAYDQILHDICLQKLPVVLMLDRAGIVGSDGPTHHGVFDLSFLRHIPNLTVMSPKDENEFRDMIYTALHHNLPIAIRYPRRDGLSDAKRKFNLVPLGQAEVLREGQQVALFAVGTMVQTALEAAVKLQKMAINCTVVNARFIKPLDQKLILELAQKHQYLITIEENVIAGGFGSAVAEFLAEQEITGVSLKILGLPDFFITQGPTELLLAQAGLDADGISHTVRELMLPLVGVGVR